MTLMLRNVDEKILNIIENLKDIKNDLEIIRDDAYIEQAQKDYADFKAGKMSFMDYADLDKRLESTLTQYEKNSF